MYTSPAQMRSQNNCDKNRLVTQSVFLKCLLTCLLWMSNHTVWIHPLHQRFARFVTAKIVFHPFTSPRRLVLDAKRSIIICRSFLNFPSDRSGRLSPINLIRDLTCWRRSVLNPKTQTQRLGREVSDRISFKRLDFMDLPLWLPEPA